MKMKPVFSITILAFDLPDFLESFEIGAQAGAYFLHETFVFHYWKVAGVALDEGDDVVGEDAVLFVADGHVRFDVVSEFCGVDVD